MKKSALFLVILAMLSFCLVANSHAEGYVLLLPEDEHGYDENNQYHSKIYNYQMLCDGDTIHFLLVQDHFTFGPSLSNQSQYSATCFVFDESGNLAECGSHCGDVFDSLPPYEYDLSLPHPYVLIRSPQNKTYFFTTDGQIMQWQPGKDKAWAPVVQLDFSGLNTDYTFRNEGEQWMFECIIDGDEMYGAFKNAGDGFTIYAFDLKDGSRKEVGYVGNVHGLNPAQEGKILALASIKTTGGLPYHLMDTTTGELEEFKLGLSTMYCSGLVYNRQGGWYYASREGDIRYMSDEGDEVSVVPYPKSGNTNGGGGTMVLSMEGTKAYLMIRKEREESYVFHTIDLTAVQQGAEVAEVKTLVFDGVSQYINASFDDLPAFSDFAAEQEEPVQAKLQNTLKYAKAISQAFVMKNDSFDVLVTHTNTLDFDNLYAKGYYVDLSDREEIVAYFDHMYPVWKDECMRDGKIIAFPARVDDYSQFMYNTELFDELGLTVPTTYTELFTALREWDDMGLLEEYRLFDINGNQTRSYEHIFFKLMADYIFLCERDGQTPDLTNQEFLSALEELDTLRDMLDNHDALNLDNTPLLIFSGYPTGLANQKYYESHGNYELMPLGYGSENREVMQCTFAVLIVNPYSDDIELAKDYIAWIAQNPTPKTQHVVLDGKPEGMESEYSIEMRLQWEADAAEAENALADAKASGDEAQIRAAQNEYAAVYAREPETEWLVKPERSRQLYQVLPDAGVRSYTYSQLMDNGEKAIERYLAGETSVRDMLQSLQDILWMMEAE